MKTYPLESISIEDAKEKQFKLLDCTSEHFNGEEMLNLGDLGVHPKENKPQRTSKVEKVIADFFGTDAAALVRGSGTGAIREALSSVCRANDTVLVHTAPIYTTTITSFNMLGLNTVEVDFNNFEEVEKVIKTNDTINAVLIQYTRQVIDDSYNIGKLIRLIKNIKDLPIITDDNYAVMKVNKIGVELGADLSCFSNFKLLGPEGVGTIVGKQEYLDKIHSFHYSGGSQVQGNEAMESLRGLVYAPVALAIQAEEINKIKNDLEKGEIEAIEKVVIANAQSKVILVKFKQPIAKQILKYAPEFGAVPHPVGAESKYEILPMFYRLSGTMRRENQEYEDYWIRINPMRSGSQTVKKIIIKSLEKVNA